MNGSITEHPLISAYLDALRREAANLPGPRRAELADEIRSHIELSLPDRPDEAEVRDLLDRLGTPQEIVAADEPTRAHPPADGPEPLRRKDVVGLALLLAGGFAVPPLGYFAGAALIGTSRRWSVPARALLVGLPAALALTWVAGLVSNHRWYLPQDVVEDPRGLVGVFLDIGTTTLPYVAAQVALLVAVRHLTGRRRG